jgi:hypothetical protein
VTEVTGLGDPTGLTALTGPTGLSDLLAVPDGTATAREPRPSPCPRQGDTHPPVGGWIPGASASRGGADRSPNRTVLCPSLTRPEVLP